MNRSNLTPDEQRRFAELIGDRLNDDLPDASDALQYQDLGQGTGSRCIAPSRWLAIVDGATLANDEVSHIEACQVCQKWKEKWRAQKIDTVDEDLNSTDTTYASSTDSNRGTRKTRRRDIPTIRRHQTWQQIAASIIALLAGGAIMYAWGQFSPQNTNNRQLARLEAENLDLKQSANGLQARLRDVRDNLASTIEAKKTELTKSRSPHYSLYLAGVTSESIVQETLYSRSQQRSVDPLTDSQVDDIRVNENGLLESIATAALLDPDNAGLLIEQAFADISRHNLNKADQDIRRLESESFESLVVQAEITNLRAIWLAVSADATNNTDAASQLNLAKSKFREAGQLGLAKAWLNLFLLSSEVEADGAAKQVILKEALDAYLESETDLELRKLVGNSL